jgi:hypothetical protein
MGTLAADQSSRPAVDLRLLNFLPQCSNVMTLQELDRIHNGLLQ